MTFALRAVFLLAAALVLAAPAHAHDPYESWSIATLRTEGLELSIIMAQSTALRLIDPEAKIVSLTPENFPTHKPRLATEGAALYLVTAGRKPLAVSKVEVELTDEMDVAFKVFYPRPAPGRLHFHAAFMKKLGAGYGGILDVSEPNDNHLGFEELSWENPNFEVTVPITGTPPKK